MLVLVSILVVTIVLLISIDRASGVHTTDGRRRRVTDHRMCTGFYTVGDRSYEYVNRNRLYVPPYPSVPTANRIINYCSFERLKRWSAIALDSGCCLDDHSAVRRAICHLLSEDPSLDVICQTSDGEDAVKSGAASARSDSVGHRPPRNHWHRSRSSDKKVLLDSNIIFLSQHDSLQMVSEALRHGDGYVTKSDVALQLLEAVRSVRNGSLFVSKRIADQGGSQIV